MSEKILLIDGSSIAYLHANKPNYQETLYKHIVGLLAKFDTNKFLIIMEDSSTNFRYKVSTSVEYKGQRRTEEYKSKIKKYLPYLQEVLQEIKDVYKPITVKGIENDDAIAILATRLDNCIMVANDRDYLSVPGEYFNLRNNKIYNISYPGYIILTDKRKIEATGYYQTFSQIIKGSSKENYSGLPKYGDVKTFNILKDLYTFDEMKEKCIELFKQHYPTEWKSKLEEAFRLCWIITHNENLITPKINDIRDIWVEKENNSEYIQT